MAGDPEVLSAAFKAPWKLRIVGRPSSSRFWQIHSLKVFATSHTLQRWDTVAGLAIKYQVHITDIRQLNNIMSDHDITLEIHCSYLSQVQKYWKENLDSHTFFSQNVQSMELTLDPDSAVPRDS
ncbi:hypothetical protein O6H91_13G098700 [Diphasiastrum complanatum]|uniref:Uncharacterized protein n=1 Tax=Diphasiastrum complanatum TaxID=34168 RepID=A0ACC2BXS1_DIPCM|nr:hypothetical protein O6H91_13G098700 [Diphasiastrum complanatum]